MVSFRGSGLSHFSGSFFKVLLRGLLFGLVLGPVFVFSWVSERFGDSFLRSLFGFLLGLLFQPPFRAAKRLQFLPDFFSFSEKLVRFF